MKRMDKILSFLKNEYGLKTDKEVAEKLGVNYNTFKNWVVRDSPNYTALLNFAENNELDLNKLFGIVNDEFTVSDAKITKNLYQAISLLDEERQNLLTLAIDEAETSDNFLLFDEHLIDFFMSSKFKSDFMVGKVQEKFWKELILADRKKIAFTVLLGKILSAFNVDIEEITEDNAKNKLVDLVERYRLQFLPNLITQSEKDTLVAWLEENLTDFDAYIILKNIPSVLNVFRRGINRLNKKAF
jgi:hypothetical protein